MPKPSIRSNRYATIAILLHWIIAALIILQVVLAGRMEGRTPEAFALVQLHKSIGITVLLLSLARLAWRLLNPPPPEPQTLAPWERALSKVAHWGFYGVMIGMPLTGWLMVSASRLDLPTLLYGTVPWPHLPGLVDLAPAAKALWYDTAKASHELIIKGFYALLFLHVAGALKHQLLDRATPVLSRMVPGAKAGRWLEPRLLIIVLGLVGVVAFGRMVQPTHPHAVVPAPLAPADELASAPEPSSLSATTTPAPLAEPVAWKVLGGSSLNFTTAWSGEVVAGRFDRWTADILFSPDALDRSRVKVSIDLASVKSGDEQRDASLPSSDWFDVATHPKATFIAERFTRTGEGRFIAHGRLSLRGVSRPLDLPFRLKIVGDRAEVSGVTSLDRTVFGVGQGEWANTDQIPAKVSIRVNVKAQRN